MKRTYRSKYSEKLVTAAQYAAELVCENISHKKQKPLTARFWNSKSWNKTFVRQVQLASSLIHLYGEFSLIKLLSENKTIISLGYKKVDMLLSEIELVKKQQRKTEKPVIKTNVKPRKQLVKPNLYTKLDNV